MANSEYEYVRNFEQSDALPLSNWIVVRVDGRGFSKLCKKHNFQKPNDSRALDLMNATATEVVRSLADVVLAYGQSDEYSFVFHESTTLFDRRAAKLATTVATLFTAEYCMQWSTHFPDKPLTRPYPTFDGRCVCYPKRKILRDYLSWRQADCHINNLYNTTFWSMVLKGGISAAAAEQALKGTVAVNKNEILFSTYGINYNNEPQMFRKGTVVYRSYGAEDLPQAGTNSVANTPRVPADRRSRTQLDKERKRKMKAIIAIEHTDIIADGFWNDRPYILSGAKSESEGE